MEAKCDVRLPKMKNLQCLTDSSVLYNQLRYTRNYILGSIISSSVANYTESRLFWPNFYKWNGILSQYHHIQSILLNWTTFLKSRTSSITFICGFLGIHGDPRDPWGLMEIHGDPWRSMGTHGDLCGSTGIHADPRICFFPLGPNIRWKWASLT